jgi:predicted ribosome quality control (RQC) complex YloA/Tae2 family protein
MPMDALTLAALAGELRGDPGTQPGAAVLGMRIEDVIQPTPQAVALHCWGGGRTAWLLASAHPQLARIHLLERKPQKLAAEPPAFVMLLRKHLDGARLIAVRQPPWERVLELGFARGAPGGAGGAGERADGARAVSAVWLVVELMGRLSNLILRDAGGTILGALRRVGPEVNRYRTIAPNEPYRPPPPQTRIVAGDPVPRLDGETLAAAALAAAAAAALAAAAAAALAAADDPPPAKPAKPKRAARLAGLLAGQVLGFSQDLGREVAARALGDAEAPLADDLPWEAIASEARALAALAHRGGWQPTLVMSTPAATGDGGTADGASADSAGSGEMAEGDPTAYAVYAPRQYGADAVLRAMPGVSALLAAYYRRAEWRDAVAGAKATLHRTLAAQHVRCLRKADVLAAELAGLGERDRLRAEGELLLTYQAEVPRGASSFSVAHPFGGNEEAPITLALDPRYTAVENANRRFARYHKLRRAADLIPPQQSANQLELARVAQLASDLELADTAAEIAQVREEVVEAGYLRGKAADRARGHRSGQGKPSKQGKSGGKGNKGGKGGKGAPSGGAPLRRQSVDGLVLLVGKNSRQNEEVTFRQATNADLWLHARGVPGAHVIVKSGGRPVPEATLREAAALAAYYSQARLAGSVPVDYTEVRYVKHLKGGGPGMVNYEREHTLQVAPADRQAPDTAAR